MRNLLLQPVEYKVKKTALGVWRRHLSEQGNAFAEFTSHARLFGLPWLHYTRGISPETGRRVTARGIVAVGRMAIGVLALGQAAFGVVAIGQAGLGLVIGVGQAACGWWALGQLAFGADVGIGQIATGATAIGQVAAGRYVLAQVGFGTYLWSPGHVDPAAHDHFTALWGGIRDFFTP